MPMKLYISSEIRTISLDHPGTVIPKQIGRSKNRWWKCGHPLWSTGELWHKETKNVELCADCMCFQRTDPSPFKWQSPLGAILLQRKLSVCRKRLYRNFTRSKVPSPPGSDVLFGWACRCCTMEVTVEPFFSLTFLQCHYSMYWNKWCFWKKEIVPVAPEMVWLASVWSFPWYEWKFQALYLQHRIPTSI